MLIILCDLFFSRSPWPTGPRVAWTPFGGACFLWITCIRYSCQRYLLTAILFFCSVHKPSIGCLSFLEDWSLLCGSSWSCFYVFFFFPLLKGFFSQHGKFFLSRMEDLRTDDVVHCIDCKVGWGSEIIILGYIHEIKSNQSLAAFTWTIFLQNDWNHSDKSFQLFRCMLDAECIQPLSSVWSDGNITEEELLFENILFRYFTFVFIELMLANVMM